MKLNDDSQNLTAFTIPGKGQFAWMTLPMRLLGLPASFQHLMETVLLNVKNVLVYIDDLLIHTSNHEHHLQVLEKVFHRLEQNHLKVNLEKCIFETKKFHTLVSHSPPKESSLEETNCKQSRMPNLQRMSKWWDLLSDLAISSELTLRILQQLLHHFSK